MCGRFIFDDEQHQIIKNIIDQCQLEFNSEILKSINFKEIFPSQKVLVCTAKNKLTALDWGYDKWDNKGIVINARSEGLETSTFFNNAGMMPCIVVASGYYEWTKEKEKYYFSMNKPLYMAGIYNHKKQFAILTKEADFPYNQIHHRMPVLIDDDYLNEYFDGKIHTISTTLNCTKH